MRKHRYSICLITYQTKKTIKECVLKKTKWPDINYGEDQHVYEPFIKDKHVKYVFVDDYAVQLKGNIVYQIFNRIMNYQQFFMSGFDLAFVTYCTRYKGFLFFARAFLVHATFMYFTFIDILRKYL